MFIADNGFAAKCNNCYRLFIYASNEPKSVPARDPGDWGCRTSKYFLLGGSPALCPNGGEIGCDFAPIPYKHSSFPDIPFGMPDFKLFCFQPLKSMLSLMKKDDSPFFRSESCNEAY